MKKLFTYFIFSLLSLTGYCQQKAQATHPKSNHRAFQKSAYIPYNSWINFSSNGMFSDQQYYKIPITKEGIYHITIANLNAAGINVGAVPGNKYQLFYKGAEQPIFVSNNSNSPLSGSNYIEFYGQGNDGQLDSNMYVDDVSSIPDGMAQPNIRYSLFCDTAVYFLTWRSNTDTTSVKRFNVQNDVNFAPHTPTSYFLRDIFQQFTSDYNYGTFVDPIGYDPDYTSGEGYCSPRFSAGGNVSYTLPALNKYSGNINGALSLSVAGRSSDIAFDKCQNITVQFNSTLMTNDTFFGYYFQRYNFLIPNSNISSSSNLTVNSVNMNIANNNQDNSIFYYDFIYPHTLDFANEGFPSNYKFILPDDTSGTSYLKLTNFTNSSNNYILFDVTNGWKVPLTNTSNILYGLVPNGGNKTCYITDSFLSVSGITSVNAAHTNQFLNFNYYTNNQRTDSAYIIVTHSSLWTQSNNYAAYRKQTGYHPMVVDVDELYNQFAWGIQKHPLAIRNFIAYTFANWKAPQYLFIIGKGIYSIIDRASDLTSTSSANYVNNLVPAYGYPTSDNLYTCRILNNPNNIYSPALPTGRLAAQTGTDVMNYLQKVQLFENAIPGEWQKQVLHFGGDSGADIQSLQALNYYASIIDSPAFGGNVTSYRITSNQVIQINQSDSLQNQINSGVSIMTFCSHAASAVGFQISTNPPNTFQNSPRFPLVIANSCLVGDINQPSVGYSEQFVLDINTSGNVAGAIAFLAPCVDALLNPLFNYTSDLYQQIGSINYGNTIGKCIVGSIDSNYSVNGNDETTKYICLEMALHGDPALVIGPAKVPDLVASCPFDIYFNPAEVTSTMTSFQMNVICEDQGRAIANDTFNLKVTRAYPSGIDSVYNIKVANCFYRDTFSLTLPVDQFNGIGINTFTIDLDCKDSIRESNKSNNTCSTTLFVTSPNIMPVYPTNYAIVPRKDSLVLKACTSNPFAPSTKYDFQIDTTDAYNSPMFRTTSITQSGGVVSWANPYPILKDSTVYFWRVSPHETVDSLYKWNEFSFIYIPNKTGWSQAHFFQFKHDSDTDVVYNKPLRRWDFVKNVSAYQALNQLNNTNNNPGFTLNNAGGDYQGCLAGLYLVVIDSLTLQPWNNWTHIIGNSNWYADQNHHGDCVRLNRPENWFMYELTNFDSLAYAINNLIPCGDFVMLISYLDVPFSTLNSNLQAAIYNRLGDHNITHMQNDQCYLLSCQLCHTNSTQVVTAPPGSNNPIVLNASLTGQWTNGTISSTVIGPASRWTSLHWKEHPETPAAAAHDYVFLRLLGFNVNGRVDTIMKDITVNTPDVNLSHLSPVTYPFLELQAYLQDTVLRTPPQMNKWQIYFDGLPDVALNPSKGFSFYTNPITGGDTLKFSTCIENISSYAMPDSLHVSFYVYDKNRVRHNLKSQTKKKMNPGDTVTAYVRYDSTQNFAGFNSFWIEANPLNNPAETYHFNNLGEIDFKVNGDITNPILDVTFDGVHILNGDIVSAKPDILIKLMDENKFLALNDTSLFQVNLISPTGTTTRLRFESNSPVPLDRAKMGWTPAQMPNNSFKIVYEPILQDGIYTLDVQAIDRSHNYSGANDYKISFEVINHESITEILNYPNPFSTSTRFVFTLTGSEIPTYFKIQIMTVTGHVVREIMLDELGPIHIGRNITQYAWNGKDQYNDPLGNGVYFYRIVTRLNGQTIDQAASGADQWISHGIGKMYLMR